jgi:hypothetical protein
MLIAGAVYLTDNVLGTGSLPAKMAVLTLINVGLGYVVFRVMDRGLLISGSGEGRPAPDSLERVA